MEPALDERGDQFDPVVGFGQGGAAMEPALDERGDSTGNIGATPPSDGRNGARSRRAGRRPAALTTWLPPRWPQWSPLSTSGATRTHCQRLDATSYAAMEPALDERGDAANSSAVMPSSRAAMEPALDERGDDGRLRGPAADHDGAAMEPALDERGDHHRRGLRRRPGTAAMEPALDERGDSTRPATTSLACCSRNGARSRRAGRPRCCAAARRWWTGRNGARSRRAGRRSRRARVAAVLAAAMEPALDERGDRPTSSLTTEVCVTQWSPLSTSGATGGGGPSTLEQ